MQFCSNCGQQLDDDARFCPNCGAKIEPDTSKVENTNGSKANRAANTAEKKPNFNASPVKFTHGIHVNKVILIPIIIAAVVVVVIAVRGSVLSNSDKFLLYQGKLLEEKANSIGEYTNTLKDGISSDLTFTASYDGDSIDGLSDMLEDSSVVLKIDADKNSATANAILNLEGSDVVSAYGYIDDDKVSFSIPELNDDYYTANYHDLLKNLDEDELSEFKYSDLTGEDNSKNFKKKSTQYLKYLADGMNKDNFEVENDNIEYTLIDSHDADGKVYTWTPSSEDIQKIINKMADKMENDKDLADLVINDVEYLDVFYKLSNGNSSSIVDELKGYGSSDSWDDFTDALESGNRGNLSKALAALLRDNAEDIGDALEDEDFTWTLGTVNNKVSQIVLSVNDIDVIRYERAESKNDKVKESLSIGGINEIYMNNEYKLTDGKYDGTLDIGIEGDSLNIDYVMDKSGKSELGIPYGEYSINSISVPDLHYSSDTDDGDLELDVQKGDKGSDHILTYSSSSENLTVTMNSSSKGSADKPTGNKVDITDYDEDDFKQLESDLEDDLNDLVENLTEEYPDFAYLY